MKLLFLIVAFLSGSSLIYTEIRSIETFYSDSKRISNKSIEYPSVDL